MLGLSRMEIWISFAAVMSGVKGHQLKGLGQRAIASISLQFGLFRSKCLHNRYIQHKCNKIALGVYIILFKNFKVYRLPRYSLGLLGDQI